MNDTLTTPDDSDFRNWIKALSLKIAAVQADLDYEQATSFCSNCPAGVDDDHWRYGQECCKESGDYLVADYAYIERLVQAQNALMLLIPVDDPLGE